MSLEHGELVAQDKDLDLFRGVGSGAQDHPAHELGQGHVDQFQRHRRIIVGVGGRQSSRSAALRRVSGTHRRRGRAASDPTP
jgi:hypothetical protein